MRRKFYFVLFGGLLMAVMAFSPASLNKKLQSIIGDVISPFSSFLHEIPESIQRFSADRCRLMKENKEMAVELAETRYEMLRFDSLVEENRKLKKLLKIAQSSSNQLIAGNVVARNISGWWEKVRLDIGSEHGVAPDMPVVGGDGLIGRTTSVSSRRSDVLLMIDPSCRISARTSDSKAFGIVRGYGITLRDDALCKMEFIAGGARVVPGEEVVTSGLGGIYPPGIVIGRVKAVYPDPSGLYRDADVIPAADFSVLDIVFVVLSESDG